MLAACCVIVNCVTSVHTSEINDSFFHLVDNITAKFISTNKELDDFKRKCEELENKDKKSQELILQLQNEKSELQTQLNEIQLRLRKFCKNIISCVTDFNSPQQQPQINANLQTTSEQQFDVRSIGSQQANQYVAQHQQQIENTQQVVQDQQINTQTPNNRLSLSSTIQQYQPQANDIPIATTDQQDQASIRDVLQSLVLLASKDSTLQQYNSQQHNNQTQDTQALNRENDRNEQNNTNKNLVTVHNIEVQSCRKKKQQDLVDRCAIIQLLSQGVETRKAICGTKLCGGDYHLGLVSCNHRYQSFVLSKKQMSPHSQIRKIDAHVEYSSLNDLMEKIPVILELNKDMIKQYIQNPDNLNKLK